MCNQIYDNPKPHSDLSEREVLDLIVRAERGFRIPKDYKVQTSPSMPDPYAQYITLKTPHKSYQVTNDLLDDYRRSLPSLGQTQVSAQRPSGLSYGDLMATQASMHRPHMSSSAQAIKEHGILLEQLKTSYAATGIRPPTKPFQI